MSKKIEKGPNEKTDKPNALSQRNKAQDSLANRATNMPCWGLPTDPVARQALVALTYYYGLDPAMGDVQILGGSTLYITAQSYIKKLEEVSDVRYGGKPFRWVKRPATPDEIETLGYAETPGARVWFVELFAPDLDLPITTAWGEADVTNCTLQNASKVKGDPRVLNRMAIKRAQHECCRDVVTFKLPSPKEYEQKLGMKIEQLLESGVNVVTDDGLVAPGQQGETFEQAKVKAAAVIGEQAGSMEVKSVPETVDTETGEVDEYADPNQIADDNPEWMKGK